MNLIFFRLIEVSTKKGRKTASMRVALRRLSNKYEMIYHSIKHRLIKYSDVTITLNNIENIAVLSNIVCNKNHKMEKCIE